MFGRRVRVVFLLLVVALPVVVGGPSAAATGDFGDVEGGVHAPGVNALSEAGILEGTECGEASFCPSEPILRSVMAVWLVRALDESPSEASASRFSDVDSDVWWFAICGAVGRSWSYGWLRDGSAAFLSG